MAVTVTQIDQFEKAIEAAETNHKLQWNYGMRETFAKDLKREIESVNGRFRYRSNGANVNIENFITQKLQGGIYCKVRPGAREKYAPVFKSRDELIRNQHQQFTKEFLQKALKHENIVFENGFEEKAIELISKNFLVGDDSERGLTFKRVTDTEIGSIVANDAFDLTTLINQLGLAELIDEQASRISKLQHRAVLRQTAANMAEAGSKPKEIEKLTDELFEFEKRSLKTGKVLPSFAKHQVESEFQKFFSLNTDDRSTAISSARVALNSIDDLAAIRSEIKKIVVKTEPEKHEGF